MLVLRFREQFARPGQNYLGTTQQGIEDFPKIEQFIKAQPDGTTIGFDIRGFDLFGYSYTKQTIRRAVMNAQNGFYGIRCLLLVTKSVDEADEVSGALAEKRLAMIASSVTDKRKFYDNYFIVGHANDVQKETLDYVIGKRNVTSGQLMKDLNLESVQAASNRIRKLADARLVIWEEQSGRARNVLNCRRIEP